MSVFRQTVALRSKLDGLDSSPQILCSAAAVRERERPQYDAWQWRKPMAQRRIR